MCVTTAAFSIYLSLFGLAAITVAPNAEKVTVHTANGDIRWLSVGDTWCTGGLYAGIDA